MLSKLINLGIVDDHTLFRKILKDYISEQNNLNVIIHSPDIPDLMSKLKNALVHVLLMDLYLPKINGAEAVSIIRSKYPEIKILVMSMCTDMELLSDLLDSGVYGIISKSDEPDELIRAIVSISEHRIYRSRIFTEVMYWNKQSNMKTQTGLTNISLNKREVEILQLLWEEKSNKEIADHLYLSIRSVEKIRQDMKEKLMVKSTVGLLKYAITKKIIRINSQLYGNY